MEKTRWSPTEKETDKVHKFEIIIEQKKNAIRLFSLTAYR